VLNGSWPTPARDQNATKAVEHSALEREIKFAVPSLDPVVERLHGLDVAQAQRIGTEVEHNYVLDTPQDELKARDERLRIREIEGRPGVLVTWKGPASTRSGVRRREERQFHADDRDACVAVLSNLGLRPVRAYDKIRTSWHLEDLIVCLDTLPFGSFVEIEFTAAVSEDSEAVTLERGVKLLGLEGAPRIQASYARLQQDWQNTLRKYERKASRERRP
jgi:adenylate cyclase class 2